MDDRDIHSCDDILAGQQCDPIDRDTLEKFAREQFNLAEPGDDVYIIED